MYCRECGKEVNEKAVMCVHCGVSTRAPSEATNEPSAALRMLLPVGRSGYAIAAGYFGICSILGILTPAVQDPRGLLFSIFAPLALTFGSLGVLDILKNRSKHGMGRAVFGIIMGLVFSVVLIRSVISRL